MGGRVTRIAYPNLSHCTLWKADRSPACRHVMMALDAMNLNISEVDVNLDRGEHRCPDMIMKNPLGTVPIFKDRELVLYDSHAISAYLASRYCNNGRLLPLDPGGRALVEQMMHYNNSVLYPMYKATAIPILYENYNFVLAQQMADIEAAYKDLECMLCERSWLCGSWPTLGDIAVASTVSTLNVMVPVDKIRYPKLSGWLSRMSEQMYYVTGNQKGLYEFSRRIDCGSSFDETQFKKCPRTSDRRRYLSGAVSGKDKANV